MLVDTYHKCGTKSSFHEFCISLYKVFYKHSWWRRKYFIRCLYFDTREFYLYPNKEKAFRSDIRSSWKRILYGIIFADVMFNRSCCKRTREVKEILKQLHGN